MGADAPLPRKGNIARLLDWPEIDRPIFGSLFMGLRYITDFCKELLAASMVEISSQSQLVHKGRTQWLSGVPSSLAMAKSTLYGVGALEKLVNLCDLWRDPPALPRKPGPEDTLVDRTSLFIGRGAYRLLTGRRKYARTLSRCQDPSGLAVATPPSSALLFPQPDWDVDQQYGVVWKRIHNGIQPANHAEIRLLLA